MEGVAESGGRGLRGDVVVSPAQGLIDTLNLLLPRARRLRTAVGFFFISGLAGISDRLASLDEIRLLVGNTSRAETIEELAALHHDLDAASGHLDELRSARRSLRLARLREAERSVRASLERMEQTDEAERLVALIARLLRERKLSVRVYGRGRLNGRAHILDYRNADIDGPGIGVVGSSNITLAGVADPTELDVVVHDRTCGSDANGNHALLGQWFDALWEDGLDFDASLLQELDRSWAARPASPWDVYMKTIYTLVRNRFDDSDESLFDDDITRSLADFQRVAVRQAISLIRKHNGCFVADVVGLGKSYVGAAIVKHFERSEGRRAIVICPKPLERMWELYNEQYALNAVVVPMSRLLTSGRGVDLLTQHPDRDFVLVDESHAFRNAGTQRYEALSTFLQVDDRKVCLLTATPRNSRASDVLCQLKLFHPGDETTIAIDPPSLTEYFREVEAGRKPLKEVLRHVMIRRTRRHILRWWGTAGDTGKALVTLDDLEAAPYLDGSRRAFVTVNERRVYFPRRVLRCVRYSIEAAYEGLYSTIRRRIAAAAGESEAFGQQLRYARYGLWWYLKPACRGDDRYASLRSAGRGLSGLVRVLLFKRLESSVAAFRATLQRLLERHQVFVDAVQSGIVPAGEAAEALLRGVSSLEDEELVERLSAASRQYDLGDFEADRLERDLTNDIAVIRSLLAIVEPIGPERDDKAQVLLAMLREGELAGRKVLIFTQFADTAAYLGSVLDPDRSRPEIAAVYGGGVDKSRVVGRFAPRANPAFKARLGEVETQILVASDVLSEGLNLQDCDIVVNYDLHWNPVRLIQRIGRIDRIGSEHDEIQAINFLPEVGIEQNLGILEILRQRIAEIHESIGEDGQILEESERINEEAMFAIYSGESAVLDEPDEKDEALDLTEADEILRRLERDDPTEFARIASLPDGIRSVQRTTRAGAFALCQAGDLVQTVIADEAGRIVTRDIGVALAAIRADRTTPAPDRVPRRLNADLRVIRARFAHEVRERAARLEHVVRIGAGQKYVLDELERELANCNEDGERKSLLQMFASAFASTLSPAVRRDLQALRAAEVRGPKLVDRLQETYSRHRLRESVQRAGSRERVVPRVVCSEALVEDHALD